MRSFRRCRRFTWTVTVFILGFASLGLCSAAEASLVVIANPSTPLTHLNKTQLGNIYLDKPVDLRHSQNVQPYNLPDNSSAYQHFYQTVLGWTPSQISSYWSNLVFDGSANPPPSVSSAAQAIQLVEQQPNAIAYVDTQALKKAAITDQVKVIYGHYTPPVAAASTQTQKTTQVLYGTPQSGYMTALSGSGSTSTSIQSGVVAEPNPGLDIPLAKQLTRINQAQTGQNLWPIIVAHLSMNDQPKNPAVQHWIAWFTHHRSVLSTMIDNATPYLYYVYQQTQQHHMPAEFTFLPMIESGYNPKAYSYAGAAGLWQLMPGTASSYGLSSNWWYDSRLDVLTATNSALTFLSSLRKNFSSWYLAAAAYNEGPTALQNEITQNKKQNRPTDYWDLPMPNQTKQYVPKLLALVNIIKNPKKYGVHLPYIPNRPFFGSVTLTSQMDLKQLSHLSGVSIPVLKELNPAMRRFATASTGRFTLLLPVSAVDGFRHNLQQVLGQMHTSWTAYKTHAGQSLSSIARQFHASVSLLKRVNHRLSRHLRAGVSILVPHYNQVAYTRLGGVSGDVGIPQTSSQERILANALKRAIRSQQKPLPEEVTGVPIKSSDSLKTLLGKLYGSGR